MSALPRLENAGMDAWQIRLFEQIDAANMPWILALVEQCKHAFGPLLIDIVPSYTTVLVQFDILQLTPAQAAERLQKLLVQLTPLPQGESQLVKELPVWYHPSVGPDLIHAAKASGLTIPAVIQQHSEIIYQVFALGFAPGFAFMGSVPAQLALPRLSSPRPQVIAGSVAIAERQTAVYPKTSPGGWNIIGRTSAKLFELQSKKLSLLEVGDKVRFMPVTRNEFERLGGDTQPFAAEQYD